MGKEGRWVRSSGVLGRTIGEGEEEIGVEGKERVKDKGEGGRGVRRKEKEMGMYEEGKGEEREGEGREREGGEKSCVQQSIH